MMQCLKKALKNAAVALLVGSPPVKVLVLV
jgi:hypothetical protein